ncbi:hypothetical protein F5144DRAFT_623378 [Chaetomium tenue]|uniref:Uncharacterized protein n=1 Tax=Chaetomium tenue TaxID=1854479 RepID=A0ACB7P0M9_9PEZI|nr:hypothetical protein F5144DRAFT_623378 [Chaetomium globosum]
MTSEATSESLTQTRRPLHNVLQLWKGHIPLPSSSLREHSYGFGWARAPCSYPVSSMLAPGDNGPNDLNPMVGIGAPSKLASALFPESGSAVVVLTNSCSRNNGVRWIGEPDYQVVAKKAAESAVQRFQDISKSLAAGRTVEQPSRPLYAYIGDYHNVIGNFLIRADTSELVPYQADSFYWTLTYDETVKLGREVVYPEEYYIVKFGSEEIEEGITRYVHVHFDAPQIRHRD